VELSQKGAATLDRLGLVYLAMEVRTGKTLTALEIARLIGAKKVLFLTKKKAIASIEKDFALLKPGYQLIVLNDEILVSQLVRTGKAEVRSAMEDLIEGVDLLIHDEHHRVGAFPKPGEGCKMLKRFFGHLPHIYLSGTPTPESYSQIYHQMWISDRSPFPEGTFYKWAAKYVNVQKKYIGQYSVNDYSQALWPLIELIVKPFMIDYTQEQAGFKVELKEHFIFLPMPAAIAAVSARLQTDGVVKGKTGIISATNAAALQQKVHQVHSGTIILDPEEEGGTGRSIVLDDFKARAIAEKFPTKKLVIFYQFCAELQAIKEVFGDRLTTDLKEFDNSDKSIALQIVSGREGLNLSAGDAIVFYNISFSATSYWQARDRLTTSTRKRSDVYWMMCSGGIEERVYKAVTGKKNYTLTHFKKDFAIEKQLRMAVAA
jgi:hypothetical protein